MITLRVSSITLFPLISLPLLILQASEPQSRVPAAKCLQLVRFEVFTAVTMQNGVALVRTDVSEELSASLISVTRIGELGTTLAVTSNRRALRRQTT
jgi:hypothetical protein